MAEEDPKTDLTKIVTKEQAVAFFEDRITNNDCPLCGKDHWDTIGMGGDLAMTLPVLKSGDEGIADASRQLPVVCLICSNCAYIRMHAMAYIKNGTNPPEGDADE